MKPRRLISSLIVALGGALALAACDVTKSDRVEMTARFGDATPGCSSTLGWYALPKAYLHVRVERTAGNPPALVAPAGDSLALVAGVVRVIQRPDPALTFCLDHINNPMSRDTVQVAKGQSSFLQSLIFNVTDQSGVVIQALARAVGVAVSGKADFREGKIDGLPQGLLADLQFDPFDAIDMARANATLTAYGFCMFVDDMSVLPGQAERFCNAPKRYPETPVTQKYREMPRMDPHGPGVFYRQKMTYRLNIYRRAPHEGWALMNREAIALQNLSPVLSLDLTRAAFANKQVALGFEDGVLTTACIAKGSEALGFMDIPLAISRSLVALPADIVQVRIDQASKSKELVEAEANVLALQKALILALQTGSYASDGVKSKPTDITASIANYTYDQINLSLSSTDLKGKEFLLPNTAPEFDSKAGCPQLAKG